MLALACGSTLRSKEIVYWDTETLTKTKCKIFLSSSRLMHWRSTKWFLRATEVYVRITSAKSICVKWMMDWHCKKVKIKPLLILLFCVVVLNFTHITPLNSPVISCHGEGTTEWQRFEGANMFIRVPIVTVPKFQKIPLKENMLQQF